MLRVLTALSASTALAGCAAVDSYASAPIVSHLGRRLATLDRGTRSAYEPDGLMPGTERAERDVILSMQIQSAGRMLNGGAVEPPSLDGIMSTIPCSIPIPF